MKMFLLAAVALATPAIAQNQPTSDSPQVPAQATSPQDSTMPAQQSAPTDTNNAQQPPSNMEQPQPASDAGMAATPNGGYQPATPPMSGQPAPGQQVTFQAGRSPSEAYPAPAPLKSYPICKKGQTDKCRQRGG